MTQQAQLLQPSVILSNRSAMTWRRAGDESGLWEPRTPQRLVAQDSLRARALKFWV